MDETKDVTVEQQDTAHAIYTSNQYVDKKNNDLETVKEEQEEEWDFHKSVIIRLLIVNLTYWFTALIFCY